jgi:hypothetical protein
VITPAQRDTTSAATGYQPTEISETDIPSSKGIIVEPLANEKPVSKFFSNDVALGKALVDSPFGRAGIEKISKNLKHNLLVITLKQTAFITDKVLLSVSKIGSWNVKC